MEMISQIGNLVLVALGIGLVIFVHEAGHFLAARWCGVRVDVFSLGFGPRLLGWQRGDTTYQIAAVPFGGYVRMAGEDVFDKETSPGEDDLRSKSVGQRFLIFSGGVIMNVIFALVIFPIIFRIGVPFDAPILGSTVPGSPAWEADLKPGTRVLSVNGESVISFMDVLIEVALSPEGVEFELMEPGATEARMVSLKPEYDEPTGRFTVGLGGRPGVDPEHVLSVAPDSPAFAAGLRQGDQLLEVDAGLPEDSLAQRLRKGQEAGAPLAVQVRRDGELMDLRIDPEWQTPEGQRKMLGIAPVINRVLAVRDHSALADLGLALGDRILSIGERTINNNRELREALCEQSGELAFLVQRNGAPTQLSLPVLERSERASLANSIALEYDPDASVISILDRSPAHRAGFMDGDRIRKIDGADVEGWEQISERTRLAGKTNSSMEILVERLDAEGHASLERLEATPGEVESAYIGAAVSSAKYTYRSPSMGQAVKDGVRSSWKFLSDAWLTLKRILRGQVSGKKNLGGIITIGVVSYSSASVGITYLLFFLCMLSVNLAFLNVLPIPLLDGGHLFFLLIEKIKGSPVSERVLGYSQMVGLVTIVSLMIYVTFNDVMRWFFPS